jgi:hypothetical protein
MAIAPTTPNKQPTANNEITTRFIFFFLTSSASGAFLANQAIGPRPAYKNSL